MSMVYAKGDLLDWPAGINVIAHGCNSFGSCGAGFARQVAERYFEAAAEYRNWCQRASGGRADLGTLLVTPVEEKRRIAWLITQAEVGTHKRQLSYDALVTAMESLRELLEGAAKEGRVWTLGVPMWIGGGLAGGDALAIQALLESVWVQSPVKCVVVEWEEGQ